VQVVTDEDVPDEVGRFLASRGHVVLLARDLFLPGTKDHVIAAGVSSKRALHVTWNRRHFKNLAKRRNSRGELSYPFISVLTFSCDHPRGLPRLRDLIDEIEAVNEIRVVQRGGRIIVDVGETVVRYEDL